MFPKCTDLGISQLDLCITSEKLIPRVTDFNVNQDTRFPPNHAPVLMCITFSKDGLSIRQIHTRSVNIGNHPEKRIQLCKHPISIQQISLVLFANNINAFDPTLAMSDDHNAMAKEFSDLLYTTITKSKAPQPSHPLV